MIILLYLKNIFNNKYNYTLHPNPSKAIKLILLKHQIYIYNNYFPVIKYVCGKWEQQETAFVTFWHLPINDHVSNYLQKLWTNYFKNFKFSE